MTAGLEERREEGASACRVRNRENQKEGIPVTTKHRRAPPHPPHPPVPSIPCCSSTLPPKPPHSRTHTHFEDPHLVTFQDRCLILPRTTASWSRRRNSPPAPVLLIQSRSELNFPAVPLSLSPLWILSVFLSHPTLAQNRSAFSRLPTLLQDYPVRVCVCLCSRTPLDHCGKEIASGCRTLSTLKTQS